jgi:hypothetical protein
MIGSGTVRMNRTAPYPPNTVPMAIGRPRNHDIWPLASRMTAPISEKTVMMGFPESHSDREQPSARRMVVILQRFGETEDDKR